jgi:hypothetical protein
MENNKQIGIKVLLIVLLSCIATAVFLIARNPITGYELSIYSSLFPFIIILIIAPVIGGIWLVIYGIFRNDGHWKMGLLIILLSNLIIVLLPYLKGYAFSDGGDHLLHLGYVLNILNTAFINSRDVYPVTHILIAQFSLITNISPDIIINFLGPLFYLLFILFTYVLAKNTLSKAAAVLAVTASSILFCYYYNEIFPMGFAFIMFPLLFFMYFRNVKTRSDGMVGLLVLMIILMVFFHPVASFILGVTLFVMECGNLIYRKFFSIKKEPGSVLMPQSAGYFNFNLPLISFLGFTLWIWYRFDVWGGAISSLASWFNNQLAVQSMTAIAQESFNKLGLNITDQLLLFIKSYGHTFIYLGLSVITIVLIIRMLAKKREVNICLFSYALIFLPLVCIWLIDYVRPISDLSSGRLISVVTAMFPVLVGFALQRIGYGGSEYPRENENKVTKAGFKKIAAASMVGLTLLVCSIIGILGIYPSPYRYQPYWGISHQTLDGESWIVENGNPSTNILSMYVTSTGSIAAALWGTDVSDYPKSDLQGIDYHFGYNSYQTLGESYAENKYMFLVSSNKLLYTELWPQVGRLNLSDFAKLENDFSISCIYNDGEAQNYYVFSNSQRQ